MSRGISQRRLLAILAILVLILFIVSLAIGSTPLSMLFAARDSIADDSSLLTLIFTEIRLPRALIALISGATLGLCGAVMQGLLRNPLASPGLIGSSSGAALGAVIMLYFGISSSLPILLPLGGMFGSLLATLLVYILAGRAASITTLILAGVAINALAFALISLLLNLAPSPYAVQEIVYWMLGSLNDRSMSEFWLLLPASLLGWMLLWGSGRSLDALTLGEDTASSMGVNLTRLRWRLLLAVSLAVGAAISITGTIGFIGLVIPHLMRPLVAYQPSRLLTVSALGGAAMLLAADIAVRLFPAGINIRVGVLTALVGAPFFLYLIVKTRRTAL